MLFQIYIIFQSSCNCHNFCIFSVPMCNTLLSQFLYIIHSNQIIFCLQTFQRCYMLEILNLVQMLLSRFQINVIFLVFFLLFDYALNYRLNDAILFQYQVEYYQTKKINTFVPIIIFILVLFLLRLGDSEYYLFLIFLVNNITNQFILNYFQLQVFLKKQECDKQVKCLFVFQLQQFVFSLIVFLKQV
eukprot:TRINITY_DN2145_c0_g1_i8.p2 TRINITY_DN2145_c0_g1~~TRINITY_DN2145_c0_g1_i8.p2  ORF type:complete len:188 (+),score=-22.66 TRINITY_DN2145_c0_g1_i8:568-1131(+)